MGVDLFFVLSGFLITGILLDSKRSDGYFTNFYSRRCLRIWPLYFSVIFFMFVVVPVMRPSQAHIVFDKSSPWWAYPLFIQNLLIPIPTQAAGPLGVMWSLAIEEQFYLIWPWVVRFCSGVQLRRIAISVICLSPLLRLFLSFHNVILYSNTFCRLDGLMLGALLAVMIRAENFVPSRFIRHAWILFFVALPAALALETFNARWFVYSLSAVASASLVYLSLYSQQKWLQAALRTRFIVYTGTVSYGLYLLHKLPFDVAETVHIDDRYPLIAAPILLVACYGLAALSWNLLEKPFLKLKRLFESKPLPPDKFAVAREHS
jgi:peptidoglycan/LPS O-acetylase OafA/YrhL